MAIGEVQEMEVVLVPKKVWDVIVRHFEREQNETEPEDFHQCLTENAAHARAIMDKIRQADIPNGNGQK